MIEKLLLLCNLTAPHGTARELTVTRSRTIEKNKAWSVPVATSPAPPSPCCCCCYRQIWRGRHPAATEIAPRRLKISCFVPTRLLDHEAWDPAEKADLYLCVGSMWRVCPKRVHPKTITLRMGTPGKTARQQDNVHRE